MQEGASVRKSRKQQQRLLRNMSAHAVVLELLQIPYEKVSPALTIPSSQGPPPPILTASPTLLTAILTGSPPPNCPHSGWPGCKRTWRPSLRGLSGLAFPH